MKKSRITLIHATPVAIEPICANFKRLWPQAQVMNLLEDSLSADLAAAGQLDQAMIHRFCMLAKYAESRGSSNCSSADRVALDFRSPSRTILTVSWKNS